MQTYTPFLKLKQNEISAIYEMEQKWTGFIVPFFDLPRPNENNETVILSRLEAGKKQLTKSLTNTEFYIDNFDVDDSISLRGVPQYEFILESLKDLKSIPVLGLNRDTTHNVAAFSFISKHSRKIAIRLTSEDIESYRLSKPALLDIWKGIRATSPQEVHLILDFRVISTPTDDLYRRAELFLNQFIEDFQVDLYIFSGSSIPAIITAVLNTNSNRSIDRHEWELWGLLKTRLQERIVAKACFGDYGVVSPDYTDIDLEVWLMQSVAAPKAFYTYDGKFFVVRGSAFKTHPNGYKQYYAIADAIVSKRFFREHTYSYGEKYIHERSYKATNPAPKSGSPSSWLKATLISHMSFIANSL